MATRINVTSRDVDHALRMLTELRGILDELRLAAFEADTTEMHPDDYADLLTGRDELFEVMEEVTVIARIGFDRRTTEGRAQAPTVRDDYRYLDALANEIALRQVADLLDLVDRRGSDAYGAVSALMAYLATVPTFCTTNAALFQALAGLHTAITASAEPDALTQAQNAARERLASSKHVRR
jgi:hypothetical protein